MNRIFVDMDEVVVDYDGYARNNGLTPEEVKRYPSAYLDMAPMPGALPALRQLMAWGFEVWLATKPPTGVAQAYADKAAWVFQLIPELSRRLIVTHDKGLLGDAGDHLCDDRPHKANCRAFPGVLLHFNDGFRWPQALSYFETLHKHGRREPAHLEAEAVRLASLADQATKGDWSRNIRPISRYPTIFAGRNTHLAQVVSRGLPIEEAEANAEMITSAPEMAACIRKLHAELKRLQHLARLEAHEVPIECP